MDTAPEPFLLLEPEVAPRLEAVPPFMPAAEPLSAGGRRHLSVWPLSGLASLCFGVPGL